MKKCVNDTLRNGTFEKPELESYLAAYQKLTGREYVEIFWKKIDYDLRHVFHLLSENEILDAVGLMKQFFKGIPGNEKTKNRIRMLLNRSLLSERLIPGRIRPGRQKKYLGRNGIACCIT